MVQGIDQIRPGLGVQMQKPNMQPQNQFLLSSQQQQVLAQSNLGNSGNYGDMDPRRLNQLPRSGMNAKDGQSTRNDGSICSPVRSNSPKVWLLHFLHNNNNVFLFPLYNIQGFLKEIFLLVHKLA